MNFFRLKKEYSQEELKQFFYYKMNVEEMEKIKKLEMDDMLSKITKSSYQMKYIKKVGYVFVGEGYLILDDGTEPVHYFVKIFNSEAETKKEIIKEYNEKNK